MILVRRGKEEDQLYNNEIEGKRNSWNVFNPIINRSAKAMNWRATLSIAFNPLWRRRNLGIHDHHD